MCKKQNQTTIHKKENSKWMNYLSVRLETIKILEENIGSKILDISCSNIFSDMSPQARETKEKINKWNYIKLKSVCTAKEIFNTIKKTAYRMGEYICQYI